MKRSDFRRLWSRLSVSKSREEDQSSVSSGPGKAYELLLNVAYIPAKQLTVSHNLALAESYLYRSLRYGLSYAPSAPFVAPSMATGESPPVSGSAGAVGTLAGASALPFFFRALFDVC